MGFYILPRANDKISINVSSEKIRTRKKEKKKVSIKHNVPRLGLGGLHHKKRREESLSANNTKKYRKRPYMEQTCLYFLVYTRKKLAIASGATPIGSAGRTPDRKKSTGERWEIEANGKEPTGIQVV
jgi:hypothetical protein